MNPLFVWRSFCGDRFGTGPVHATGFKLVATEKRWAAGAAIGALNEEKPVKHFLHVIVHAQ